MVFTKRLREGIRRGRIRCSIRIWMRPQVKAGGRYRMDEGHVVVDSITPIHLGDISDGSTTCPQAAGMCRASDPGGFLPLADVDRQRTSTTAHTGGADG